MPESGVIALGRAEGRAVAVVGARFCVLLPVGG